MAALNLVRVPEDEQRQLARLMVDALRPGAELADCLASVEHFLRRFVVFPSPHESVTATLWTAHTHAVDSAEVSPYLAVTSPEKRSGKTRLLDALELLVARPWRAVSPSEAVIYRKVEADRPTLMLDEVDAIYGPKPSERTEGLRALLNAGNRRRTTVPRMVGEGRKMSVQDFPVYCAKALAGIGRLPDTVADRAIPVRLERRARGEPVERFRYRTAHEDAEAVRAALMAALEPVAEALEHARPNIPDALGDRAADSWEPLLAIADAAGGKWPARARAAAAALSGETPDDLDDASLSLLLLADCRAIFDRRSVGKLLTAQLIEDLAADEERPWREYGRHDRPITPHGISRLLRAYAIRPEVLRFGESTGRGYRRSDFEAVWARYLPPATERTERNNVTAERGEQVETPHNGAARDVVTDERPFSEGQVEAESEGHIEAEYAPGAWDVTA